MNLKGCMHFLEYGVIKKKARYRVALIYPNLYKAGNSNLGFFFVYNMINDLENFQCERFFTDFKKSIETNSILKDFDILAFSCSFEMDLFTVYEVASQFPDKMKIIGGRTSYNPFPVKDIVDYVFVGDAEESLPEFLKIYEEKRDLDRIKRRKKDEEEDFSKIQGVFAGERTRASHAPLEYHPVYQPIQWGEYPEAFTRSFLLEISRGCSRNCKFCLVSHCVGRKRERSVDQIQSVMEKAEKCTKFETVCLIGPDSHSGLLEIIEILNPYRVSLPSLRLGEISAEVLAAVNPNMVTVAPETSQRLRFTLGKPITDEEIVQKAILCSSYVHHMKLYFMVGLPGETRKDWDSIVELVKKVSKIINTTVTVAPFVPKPHTPFSHHRYDTKLVERALAFLRKRIQFSSSSARRGFIQWALSVGDERVTPYLKYKKYSVWKKLDPAQCEPRYQMIEV